MSYFTGLHKPASFYKANRPVVIPYKTLLQLDPSSSVPLYVQVSEQLRRLLQTGSLLAGHKLPGTRQLADLLGVHRQTIVSAYDEGLAQGWLESRPGSGTYVAAHIPAVQPQVLETPALGNPPNETPGYSFAANPVLARPLLTNQAGLRLDDGFPDIRLAPIADLSRAYRSYFRWGNPQQHFGYGDTKGHLLLREQLSLYLNETRGLHTTPENVLITRGSIMGLYLTSQVLLRPGDVVVTGETTWAGAVMNVQKAGATIRTVPVDQHGLDVAALANLCDRQWSIGHPIRLVFVTPHHHYPTTVTLKADRRVWLLQLANEYGFAILEDDYDYDFHYLSRPILPLASADQRGMVVYVGSLTKSVAPAFRIGYVVAPSALIDELARLRRIIDRQGDPMLEFAVAQLFKTGEMQRHFRKALRTYQARRDRFCELLTDELPEVLQFTKPDGGMAVWATFDPAIDMEALAQRAGQQGLFIASGLTHNPPDQLLNGTRLGFASSTEEELERSVLILKKAVSE
ncbi:transcriptional regulator, GntR family with aminotransferase domain [Fibrisoma limi BUZ 3]|uniref:Transcriptional regulator, GntR family with aminotransferase domain n=1 Tax=Fibrisoma limi BUZ 3 TaxID=1185876 RepID=I2GFL8_9BACT|nr:PLP-dependent aminotransferase family protein [Fibrisoma limi]CCH52693.1 transcriptional regulator, GntR family with aminotransferase domain [Fibrisoma limi BUZ 3]